MLYIYTCIYINSLPNAPSRVRRSEENRQAVEEKNYPDKIELENEGSNEN